MAETDARMRRRFITLLFDTKTNTILGKHGRWVKGAEFEKDPPKGPEEVTPQEKPIPDPPGDPNPEYVCINGVLHICMNLPSGRACWNLGAACE